jgi:hypothetical protein
VHVHDELCDRDPNALQRLGKELSYAVGGVVLAIGVEDGAVVHYTLFDRGGAVDEYVSVPEYHGPLPPGDVVARGKLFRRRPEPAHRQHGLRFGAYGSGDRDVSGGEVQHQRGSFVIMRRSATIGHGASPSAA